MTIHSRLPTTAAVIKALQITACSNGISDYLATAILVNRAKMALGETLASYLSLSDSY